jgi:branched-chain amino acid transport system substrate-binding protein
VVLLGAGTAVRRVQLATVTKTAGTAVASASASASALTPACTAKACAAAHPGEAWVCRKSDSACVAVASEDCTPHFEPGDVGKEDTVWVGAMFPLKGADAKTSGDKPELGVEFARTEVAEATRPFDSPTSTRHVRRIAEVECDDATNAMRAAKHLVEDVGVPAIIGFGLGDRLVEVATAELMPHEVIALAPLTQNPNVTRIPRPTTLPPMVWRTTFSAEQAAAAAARLVDRALVSARIVSPALPNVVFAHTRTQRNQWFADRFYRGLVDDTVPEGTSKRTYDEVVLDGDAASAIERQRVATSITNLAPDVVVFGGPTELLPPIVEAIERSWASSRRPRPSYLLNICTTEAFDAYLGRSLERRRRLYALCSPSDTVENARFVARFNSHASTPVTLQANPSSSYDAFYAIAYAAFSLTDQRVGGVPLARAFGRLGSPGVHIEVGPIGIFDGIRALDAGGNIDLTGAASSLDFDLSTGEIQSDLVLVCPGIDASGAAYGDVDSGIVFRARTNAVEGTSHCP